MDQSKSKGPPTPEMAYLTYNGKTIELPVLSASEGPKVLNIADLYKELDVFTYDPGFTSTASCTSNITFIDGEEGRLLYRGYPIQTLAVSCDFLEVAYLLLHGDLPNAPLDRPRQRTESCKIVMPTRGSWIEMPGRSPMRPCSPWRPVRK